MQPSYQVIARKYRPQRFEDVVGQEHVTQTLGNAIRAGRIAHAYLFCGPRGTGKTTIARIFAKALNCTDGPKADFDDTDPRCREIAEGRSLDVLEIDGASNNGVEQVRELRETARFAPASSKFKIYIIDEVHMLTTAAFNALLKTLEEPPAHVKFLFATTDPEKVLPTILSRCQRFDLRRIPSALIVGHLSAIAAQEGVTLDDAALHAIARGADGGMRDAESILDQLISFCGEHIQEADVLSMFGLAARSQLRTLSRGLLAGDASTVLRELDALVRGGKDLARLLSDLLDHFRNLLVHLVTGGDASLMEVSEAESAELAEQAGLASAEAVTRILDVLTAAEGRLREASARRIFLEVTLLKAIQARKSVSLDSVLQQLQRLRQEAGTAGSAPAGPSQLPTPQGVISPATAAPAPLPPSTRPAVPNSPPPTPTSTPIPIPTPTQAPARPAIAATSTAPVPTADASPGPSVPSAAKPAPIAADSPDLPTLWDGLVATSSPLLRTALQAGRPIGLEKGILSIGYPASQDRQRSLVDNDRARGALEAKLAEMGRPATVRFLRVADEPGSQPPPATASAGPASASPTASPPGETPTSPAAVRRRPEKPEKVVPIKLDPAEFKNDPLIKEALELFKGQLVEVRAPESPEPGPSES